MSQSHRGQFGPVSLLVLLALTAASAVAETLPPLRINPALLGAGTPPPSVPVAAEPLSAAKPAASAPVQIEPVPTARVDLTPQQAMPVAAVAPQAAAPAARAAPLAKPTTPVARSAAASTALPVQAPTPVPLPQAAITEAPRRAEEPKTTLPPPAVPLAEAIQKPQEPPQVEERPVLPPLYSAHVAAGELPDPQLKPTAGVMPYLKRTGELLPTFIAADHIAGKNDVEVVAEGDVELRKRNTILLSDRLTYWQEADEMEAEGKVHLSHDGDRVLGPKMRMKMGDSTGFFERPEYSIRRIKTGSAATLWTGTEQPVSPDLTTGQGVATRMEFEGEGKYRLTDATYSTCTPAAGHDPDWYARAADLRLDYDEEQGTARNATLYFKGTPILYSPWLSFSLNNERKSGLLTPTFGSTGQGGLEYTQPFYWNIAQDMDATIAPRVMAKRGTMWNGEYRYLENSYQGTMQGEYLPNDKITHTRRSAYSLLHSQNLGNGFSGSLALNGASDDTFFSDLGRSALVTSPGNLLREGRLGYAGDWWSANLLAQSYQTLQDPSLPPVTDPYRRLPQVTLSANRSDLPLGLSFAFSGEGVNFRSPTQVEGRRFMLYPQLSLPLQTEVLSITPKIGLHSTSYTLANQPAGSPEKLTRSLPIFSVDSGVTFERDIGWQGQALTQTLEPRLYYLYVPVRDQSQIPVFDTAPTDFNFAQMFAENPYGGIDRIGDANQLTAMLSSRLLDPLTGAELMRAAIGQRFYFSTQHAGLPATATTPAEVLRTNTLSDFLGSFSGRVLPKTYADVGIQYTPNSGRLERLNVGARYQPEAGKVLNAGYRYATGQLGQVDISGQWPLFDGWHAVGRINYSSKDSRMAQAVAGLEYDGGCWVGRVVIQRLATQTQQTSTGIFFQLELNGFAKLGSNPLDLLKRSVPGYGVINQPGTEAPLTTP